MRDFLDKELNRRAINDFVGRAAVRPQPFSLWNGRPIGVDYQGAAPERMADYVSWAGLTDRRFTGRHLGPADDAYMAGLPPIDKVIDLFRRREFRPSTTTSAFFCFFAQWFTDSFLRTHPLDLRLNTSNHEVDLCQIYGLDAETGRLLRTLRGGRLKTSADGLFPALLFDGYGMLRPEFAGIPYMVSRPDGKTLGDVVLGSLDVSPEERTTRKSRLYATGLERGNSTLVYTAISSVFIREHNRICRILERAHPDWDDDRLFETARNVNIVILLGIIVNEYINHLTQSPAKLSLDRGFAELERWYRTNRISIEFGLLYRWHSLVPDTLALGERELEHTDYRFNNAMLEKHGVEAVLAAASIQPAGRIGLVNNPDFLREAEVAAHKFARSQWVRPFTSYQKCFGETPANSFEELVGEPELAKALEELYGTIDNVELVVGLFAQRHDEMKVLPATMETMVAVDAFSQILTNPLLSGNVYGEMAFSAEGERVIDETKTFADVVHRNLAPGAEKQHVGFDLVRSV